MFLTSMRRAATAWLARLLLLLLILSFGVWGIGDMLRPAEPVVARIGGSELGLPAFSALYGRETAALGPREREALGQPGVAALYQRRVAENWLRRTALDLEAERAGLIISSGTLAFHLASNPAFRRSDGRLNPVAIENAARNLGMSRDAFLGEIQDGLRRDLLLDAAVSAPQRAPPVLLDSLAAWRNERRSAVWLRIREEVTRLPDDEELEQLVASRPGIFSWPAMRVASWLVLDRDALVAQMTPTEEEIRAAWEDRQDQFRTPEKRTFFQQVLPSREEAASLLATLRGRDPAGAGFQEDSATVMLGPVSRDELPDGPGEAIFAAAIDSLTGPVESPFGWHVIQVTGIEPAREPSLDEVRDRLVAELGLEKADDRLDDLVGDAQDMLAGGATLEEIAGQLGVTLYAGRTVDAGGRGPAGEVVIARRDLLGAVMAARPGDRPDHILRDDGGAVLFEVTGEVPSRPKTLAEAREDAMVVWNTQARTAASRERAEALLGRLGDGASLEEIASGEGLLLSAFPAVDRHGRGGEDEDPFLLQEIVTHLFGPGGDRAFVACPGDGSGSCILARPGEITRWSPSPDDHTPEDLAAEIRTDMLEAMIDSLVTMWDGEVFPGVFPRQGS